MNATGPRLEEYTVKRTPIITEKIFTVDPSRPGAGNLKYTAKFDPNEQYLKQVTSELDDFTIREVAAAFDRIFRALELGKRQDEIVVVPPKVDKPVAREGATKLIPVTEVVAAEIFEFDDPMFESRIQGFLGGALGSGTVCSTPQMEAPVDKALIVPQVPPHAQHALPLVPPSLTEIR